MSRDERADVLRPHVAGMGDAVLGEELAELAEVVTIGDEGVRAKARAEAEEIPHGLRPRGGAPRVGGHKLKVRAGSGAGVG